MLNKKILKKIVIGTAQFGLNYGIANSKGKIKISEIKKIIKFAKSKGITKIDTAHAYGDCERRLGKVGIKSFDVIIKLPATEPTYPYDQWVKKSINSSLKKMKIKKAETVLIHNVKYLLNRKMGSKIYNELSKFKEKKIINNIGVSLYSVPEVKKVSKKFDIDLILMSLNIFDQRITNKNLIKYLKKKKIKIYTRSTFLQGLLLMPKSKLPKKFYKWKKKFDTWYRELYIKKVNPYDVCLNFVLNNKNIHSTLIGVDDFIQFKELFKIKKVKNFNYNKLKCDNLKNLINPSMW
tara:strand:+ start:1217 stop:2095 length:879 start_codon:yes stop_codon:yes gene_type:complete